MLRRLAVVVATGLAGLGFGLAHAGNAGAATYTVCGVGVVLPVPGGGTCTSLPDAIAAAQVTPEADTIRMLPGEYCPFIVSGATLGSISFVGVGIAGLSGGTISLNGPEASLTEIKYDSGHCGSPSTAVVELDVNLSSGGFTFQNLTIDGTGIGYGLYDFGFRHTVTLRDVIVQNASSFGIYYLSGCCSTAYNLEVDNSAILNNGTSNGAGAQIFGFGTIRNSTIAGNGLGVGITNADVALLNDTISHNQSGVNTGFNGNGVQAVNTIVADNTFANCSVANDWEQVSPFDHGPGPSSHNLLEGQHEGCPNIDGTDAVVQTLSMPAVLPNGGPTPSIMTPLAADGHGASSCGLNGVDQREAVITGSTCDDGAVQQSALITPVVAASDVDLGTVAVGSSTPGTSFASNDGGDLVGVSGVSISGAGWSITSDGCTYAVMEKAFGNGCSVGVSVHPTGGGTWNGTLTVHTTAGNVTAHLHAQTPGIPPSIAGFAPSSGPTGTTVTITGAQFTGATEVAFGGTSAQSFSIDSDTQITAVVAVGTVTGNVTVTNPGGTATSAHPFVVVAPRPLIYTLSPGQGLPGSTVTILGQNLSGASAVTFGGVPAISFSSSNGSVTATVPGAALTGHIAVTTPGGTATSTGIYTVIPLVAPTPTITSFSPSGGIHGVQVRIRGTGLTGATSVKFNGKPASFTVQNDTTILATVPIGATTGPITVTTPGGSAASGASFTI